MEFEGGCYCRELRYKVSGDALFKGQCHCRECQYLSGGSPNVTMGVPSDGFEYTKGSPKKFQRTDLDNPVTREFCGNCGTQILSLAPVLAGVSLLKVGTMDNPSQFGKPDMAIFTLDKQAFHTIPAGMPAFERLPDGM